MQRTRCSYFYDIATPCNKRGARRWLHRRLLDSTRTTRDPWHERALYCHPSIGHVRGIRGAGRGGPCERDIARARAPSRLPTSNRLPGDKPQLDTNTTVSDEIITAVELPAEGICRAQWDLHQGSRKRTSFAFALVSVAAALENGRRDGSWRPVGRPWRRRAQTLARRAGRGQLPQHGQSATTDNFTRVAQGRSSATRKASKPQRLQNRAGEARHRPRPRPSRGWEVTSSKTTISTSANQSAALELDTAKVTGEGKIRSGVQQYPDLAYGYIVSAAVGRRDASRGSMRAPPSRYRGAF